MRQTLFYIPHEWYGIDVLGVGWLLALWMLVGVGGLVWLLRRPGGGSAALGYLPFFALVAFALAFVFPMLEARGLDGQRIGLPVRGYGMFVLAGFASGVGWAMRRAERRGIRADTISSLALWLFVAGFAGARLFFVMEYWEDFQQATLRATLVEVVRITEGGLVVYGALLAVLPTLVIFCRRYAISPLVLGDVVAPSFALGLALGRLGCLMNGCCYGGVCEHGPIAIQFPRYNSVVQRSLSPPYQHQLATGRLHGFAVGVAAGSNAPVVRSVAPDGPAARAGLTAGQVLRAINGQSTPDLARATQALLLAGPDVAVETSDGRRMAWTVGTLPARSLPVHPVQVYSAINALLVGLVVVASEPYLRRPGSQLALMLTLYPPLRMVEEIIRVDEPGQFGTGLSISQLISLGMFGLAAGLWLVVFRGSPPAADSRDERADQHLSVA